MLRVSDLTVHYGRIAALRGIDLHVEKGEAVALIGPNGAGKTTTLASIAGLVRPSSGSIEFRGESLARSSPERIVRQGVALVPEGRRIFATLSVAENLRLGATPLRGRVESDAAIEDQLERFPVLRRYFDTPAGRLSGGEQQQLAIARALVSGPELLLLDEPSLGLAPILIDLVFETLEVLRAEGITVLLVEQNARRSIAFADRTYVLRTGRVVVTGTREDFTSKELSDLYLGSEDTVARS